MRESLFGDPLQCIPDERTYGYCQEMAHMCIQEVQLWSGGIRYWARGRLGEGEEGEPERLYVLV